MSQDISTIDHIVGSSKAKHFIEQRRQSIFIDYLIATSTHGLRSVGRAYSKFNRFFWIIIFTIAFGLMFYFVRSAVLRYYSYPTETKIEIRLDRSMIFPAVTICSGNPYRYDKTNASLVSYFQRIISSNAEFNQKLLNSFLIPLIIDLFNHNQTKELSSIGFQLSDFLLSCTYNGINCSELFTKSISSSLGNCFTFNWKTSQQVFTISDFATTFVLNEVLSMTFYIPQEVYFPNAWFDIGLIILLHDNDALPIPRENSLFLQPGQSHLITYRKSETIFLQKPYSNCTSSVSDDLRDLYKTTFLDPIASIDAVYSESLCLELCEQAYIFSQCSCILPMPFYVRKVFTLDGRLVTANFCSIFNSQISCTVSAKQQLLASSDLQKRWCSRCVPQCLHTYFNIDLSAQLGPSKGDNEQWYESLVKNNLTSQLLLPNDFADKFDYYFNRNYMKVLVSCGSQYVTEYKQVPKLTIIDTFSAIGGQTGL